jgi:NADH-quinone oxidoreductase subunit N
VGYAQLFTLVLPEAIVAVTALVVLTADIALWRRKPLQARFTAGLLMTVAGAVVALGWLLTHLPDSKASFADGALVIAPLSQYVKAAILLLTILTACIAVRERFTAHAGEYFALLLLATTGMMFLVSSENILMIFIALELLSLSLYILAAFNKKDLASAEAALKYFLFGGTSAAVMLFGLGLIYGMSGELGLVKIAGKLKAAPLDSLTVVGLIMVAAGLAFKVAAAPFHLWAPDAYQGAPIPSAAFIASGSKVASFFILAKIVMLGFDGAEGSGAWGRFQTGWVPMLALLAAASILVGNLAAIVQSSVRRLLAYSAVAHAGYILVGLLGDHEQGVASVLFYALTYAVTTVGAFAVVGIVQDKAGHDRLDAFAGLGRTSPVLAFCMMIFLLSLAGIPPLVGFFGKVYLFAAALNTTPADLGLLWLVILAIGMSAVSLYYYLQVLKQIYVIEPAAEAPPLPTSLLSQAVVVFAAITVIALGLAPNLLVGKLLVAMSAGF